VIGITVLTPVLSKKVTPAPAPKFIKNLHSASCLRSENLKAVSILPHEAKASLKEVRKRNNYNFLAKKGHIYFKLTQTKSVVKRKLTCAISDFMPSMHAESNFPGHAFRKRWPRLPDENFNKKQNNAEKRPEKGQIDCLKARKSQTLFAVSPLPVACRGGENETTTPGIQCRGASKERNNKNQTAVTG